MYNLLTPRVTSTFYCENSAEFFHHFFKKNSIHPVQMPDPVSDTSGKQKLSVDSFRPASLTHNDEILGAVMNENVSELGLRVISVLDSALKNSFQF